jgi:hypothetical protein
VNDGSERALELVRVPHAALPEDVNVETKFAQFTLFAGVTRAVRFNLLSPKRRIRPWNPSKMATWMTMPEAAVHEERPPTRAIRKVGPTRQSGRANAESDTVVV